MKLKRIAAIPFALLADFITLGKMGEGSFTQDIFDAEKIEKERELLLKILKILEKL